MTGLLDRIAAAFAAELMELTADQRRSFNFHDASGDTIDRARGAARHALRAIREPTENMSRLAASECSTIDLASDTDFENHYAEVWRTMIDAEFDQPVGV